MSYSAKFGFAGGYNLIFTAFQPDGIGRGQANQPLYEIKPTGFYRAEPSVILEDGDTVLVYNNETLYWENDPLYYLLTYGYMLYDGEQMYWEGEPLYDYDEAKTDMLTWVGDVVGSGEYTVAAGESSAIVNNTTLMIVEAQRVQTVVDETVKPTTVAVLQNL